MMVTPLVSHILGFIVYQVGNLALTIIKPDSRIFTLAADGSITGDPNVVGPATAACVVLIVLMIVGALLLLASPYISYKIAFGQIFEAVLRRAASKAHTANRFRAWRRRISSISTQIRSI